MIKPLFPGLVYDESGNLVEVAYVGLEPCYIVNDHGFKRHISSEQVDRQVLTEMRKMIEGHEEIISEQTARMIGQDDIFSRAMIINQLKQIDKQFDQLLQIGIPEDARAYLGMMGFRIVINVHGEVQQVEQPGIADNGDDEGGN